MVIPASAQICEGTPFECAVDAAIDAGLQNLRNAERGTGHFGDGNGRHNFLPLLSFLEKRRGVGWNGRAQGFEGMDPADQAMAIRVQTMIANEAHKPKCSVVYLCRRRRLMALAAFSATGGPDDVGANVTVTQAIANGVVSLQRNQGNFNRNNAGGWNYTTAQQSGDLSTTQFGVAGLSAAANVVDGADATVPAVVNFLRADQGADGAWRIDQDSNPVHR